MHAFSLSRIPPHPPRGQHLGVAWMHAFFLSLLLTAPLVAQELTRARPEEVGLSSERLRHVANTIQGYVDRGELPGAVVLIARNGRIAYHEAFGARDIAARAPLRPDDIFRIASQTKALVSVGIMMLQEEGALLISHPVGRYLPEFAATSVAVARESGGYDVVPAKRPITIRDLLTHTAGIGYGYGPAADRWADAGIQGWYFASRDEPVAATVARMARLPMDAQPGESWVYGYGTDILGVLIERVSGMPLDRFIRTRILDPLGMNDTHFFLPPDQSARLATVYSLAPGARVEPAPDPGSHIGQGHYVAGPRTAFSGGAGLLSTAHDYARFLQMLLNGGQLDGVRLLSPKTVQLMTVNHVGDLYGEPGLGFGLGFRLLEDLGARGEPGSVGEFGWGGAYHSTYWVDPREQLLVVYFTQLIPAGGLDDFARLRTLVYQAIVTPHR